MFKRNEMNKIYAMSLPLNSLQLQDICVAKLLKSPISISAIRKSQWGIIWRCRSCIVI